MRIKLIFMALLLGCVMSTSAQRYQGDYDIHNRGYNTHKSSSSRVDKIGMVYGVMGGMLLSTTQDRNGNLEVGSPVGYQMGFMWGVELGRLGIVPEVWYQRSSTNCEDVSSGESGRFAEQNIEVPILLAIKLPRGVRLNVGPSFSLMNSGEFETDDDIYDMMRTRSTAGYLVGVSVTLWSGVILDARYRGQFSSLESEVYIGGSRDSYEYQTGSYSLNIGYRF